MTKEIPLHGKYGQGKVALVDDTDFPELSQYKWYVSKQGYAVRYPGEWRNGIRPLFMHKSIMATEKGHDVDHANANRLDNRRCNLRQATRSQNSQNKRPRKNSTIQYKGIGFHKASALWYAEICLDGKRKRIGYFSTQREAAVAYNVEAIRLFGEFARLNTIPETDGPDAVVLHEKHKPKSEYKGVYWDEQRQLWAADFQYQKKKYHAGRFPTEEEAAKARDEVAIRICGPHVKLNFPD